MTRHLMNRTLVAAAVLSAFGCGLVGCDNTKSSSKTTTTKKESTPEGERKVTETHEKTVETDKK